MDSRRLLAISLFSGAGGMDIGFMQAGYKVLACVESDPSCCQTLRTNLPNHTLVIEDDIRNVSGSELLMLTGVKRGDIDCLFGGPPCQSFSLAGARKGMADDRGQLVLEFIRLVNEIQPRSFVMENVKGMANWQGGIVLDFIKSAFSERSTSEGKAKYEVQHSVLNSASFGVPQVRERIFIVGNRLGKKLKFPSATHGKRGSDLKPYAVAGDALFALPPATPPSATALRIADTIQARREKHGY
jgi:DNA (cytosine-5)-methyltransferase 1